MNTQNCHLVPSVANIQYNTFMHSSSYYTHCTLQWGLSPQYTICCSPYQVVYRTMTCASTVKEKKNTKNNPFQARKGLIENLTFVYNNLTALPDKNLQAFEEGVCCSQNPKLLLRA